MTESPEKKVLKTTLSKLKSKSITSIASYKASVKAFQDDYVKMYSGFKQETSQLSQQEKKTWGSWLLLLGVISQSFQAVITSSFATIDDMQIYADTLESYSAELDDTLTSIFEQANNYAKEKEKEQAELAGKDRSASYVK